MNRVVIVGNLVETPEMRQTKSGVSMCSFRVAVNRRFKGADGHRDADFFQVVAWRQTADYCCKYLLKGSKVGVEGSMQSRQYDAQDGSKRTVWELIADNVEGLERASERATGDSDGFVEVEDDGLPF